VDSSARDGPLAGLVSQPAERLYARLLEAGWLEIGPGAEQISLTDPAAAELVDARIAYRSHIHQERLLPVARATALQLLLTRQHADIMARQQTAIDGWELLDSILTTSVEPGRSRAGRVDSLVEVITGIEDLNHISYELYHSAKRELLGLTTGKFGRPIEQQSALTPSAPATTRGAQFRMIYDAEVAANPAGARIIEVSAQDGEHVRIRSKLPLKMLHVDDSVALVALTVTAVDGSLLVRSPALLAALREWFEYMWNDEGTTVVDGVASQSLSAIQRQILRLLSSGMSDEAIARACNASVRTVRRHIAVVLEMLGVNSRFAAGAMAAKRGWI
jgi:DNA-binding CsgD family transcriptional regulator